MASEDFFVTEFGWGDDWASDHSSVIPVRECVYITCLPFLFTLFCLHYLFTLFVYLFCLPFLFTFFVYIFFYIFCLPFLSTFSVYLFCLPFLFTFFELIFHVPTFAKKHKTVGFYGEEKGECMHKVVNQQSRQLCSVCNPTERNLLIHKNMELSSNTKCQCFLVMSS